MPRRAASSKPAASKKRTKAKRTLAASVKESAVKPGAPIAGRVIERPDGFYWESLAKKRETRGPFATLAEAQADMLSDGGDDEEAEVPEALQEAESELGINEWIDPDTGGPAEDNVPRIEDH
jgi:hypothetical protein